MVKELEDDGTFMITLVKQSKSFYVHKLSILRN